MELKVQCACGQKYVFDVEPVNGQMPFTVNCPVCGVDGTAGANAILRETLAASTAPASPPVGILASAPAAPQSAPALVIAAPAPTAPAPPPARPAGAAPRLRINKPVAEAPAPAVEVTESAAAPPPAARATSRGFGPAPVGEPKKGSFAMGLLGALLGALIGSAIYYVLFSYTGFRIKLIAIAVGFLAGLGARVLGKEGSNELGVITATLALLGIFGAQYFVVSNWWHESDAFKKKAAITYESGVAEAKEVLAAIPTGSNEEIRAYLAKETAAEMNEKPNPGAIDADDVAYFRDEDLPKFRDLASGKITKEEFEKEAKAKEERAKAEQDEDEGTFKTIFMVLFMSKVNLFSLAAAAALAYKMSTDA